MVAGSVTGRRRPPSSERPPGATGVRVGDTVVADDGVVGCVDSVVRSENRTPEYVVVSVGRFLARRYPVVPCSLVTAVDRRRHLVTIQGRRDMIRHLPETVPLVL